MTLTQIFYLVLIVLVILAYVLPTFMTIAGYPLLKQLIAKQPVSKQEQILQHADTVVRAIEQIAQAAIIPLSSEQKKAQAVQELAMLLKDNGITISESSLSTYVEAAVFKLNQQKQAASIALPAFTATNIPAVNVNSTVDQTAGQQGTVAPLTNA